MSELRDACLKILKGAFNIGWSQGEREMGRGRGGESYHDGGKVKEMIDADVEKLVALIQKEQGWRDDLNTLLSAVEQALKDYNENGHYLSAETGYVLQGAFDLFPTPPQGEDG